MEPKESKSSPEQPVSQDRPRIRISSRDHRQTEENPQANRGSNRETIESVVIAFVLAFLFRTFEAEAFVIPTGSMAPTLMGRHKEATCKECGQVFTVGETEESERSEALTESVCPNCLNINNIRSSPAFKGDRILVLKALYDLPDWTPGELNEPKRWDVVVFKFPEEPQVNYIKRLVGLPGEAVRIHYGNIYTRSRGDQEFHIARKSAAKQKVMRMLVYDNNHQPSTWRASGWPNRWQSESGEPWKEFDDGRSFESPAGLGESTEWARISYHHLAKMWRTDDMEKSPPREHLINDFYSYNAGLVNGYLRDEHDPRWRWVGDLSMTIRAEITAPRGKLRLELVEAGDQYICEFDLTTGSCQLLRLRAGERQEQVLTTTAKGIVRPGRYSIGFGNTDDRLTVWLDDRLLFGDGFDYDGARLGDKLKPTLADLRPASVAVQGTHMRLSDLVLYRDIYYTHGDRTSGGGEYDTYPSGSWEETFSDPRQWDLLATARISSFDELGPDDFMMMGDNSPRSKDGRLWDRGAHLWVDRIANEDNESSPEPFDQLRARTVAQIAAKPGGEVVLAQEHVVHRQLLIGRAFFVYWPHGVPFGPEWLQFDTPRLGPLGSFRLPFYPNVSKMKMIE